jgi:hypothetical protein
VCVGVTLHFVGVCVLVVSPGIDIDTSFGDNRRIPPATS